MQNTHSTHGYTMVELILTVLIALIITAIAIPAYQNYSSRARIPEATSQLISYQLKMEQYFQDNQNYGKNLLCGVVINKTENFSYQCVTSSDGQSYLLTAKGSEENKMSKFSYTINETGKKQTTALPSEWGVTPKDCWVVKENMTCM